MTLPKGWFTDENIKEYRNLVEKIPYGGTLCELGCAYGRSLCSVADIILRKNIKVYVIDTFEGTKNEEGVWSGEGFRKEFEKNIKEFGIDLYTFIYQGTTDDELRWFKDIGFDLLFIDADHSYEQVKKDIQNYLPLVKGTISGHDFSPDWQGVVQAVSESFDKVRVKDNIWSYNKNSILAYVNTKDRYDTTLPLTLNSIATQTLKPDNLIIFDDNNEPRDLRQNELYQYIFKLLDDKGIGWQVIYGQKKGQHHNHESANQMDYKYCWRIDDDEIAEPNVLEELLKEMKDDVGAVGGLVIQPPYQRIGHENIQWFKWEGEPKEVDHLYSSFLYRPRIAHYDLRLSPVAHREETIFSMSLKEKGYKLIVTPKAITHHLRSAGGIRSHQDISMYDYDEKIFQNWLKRPKNLYVVHGGLGDHYMFKQAIELPKDAIVACCYPEVFKEFKTISIEEANQYIDTSHYDVYKWCWSNNWKGHFIEAIKKVYENTN